MPTTDLTLEEQIKHLTESVEFLSANIKRLDEQVHEIEHRVGRRFEKVEIALHQAITRVGTPHMRENTSWNHR